MKLIVTEEDLILDTHGATYTMKRAFEEDEWHVINEFVDLNFYENFSGFHANLHFVNEGVIISECKIPLDIEFA